MGDRSAAAKEVLSIYSGIGRKMGATDSLIHAPRPYDVLQFSEHRRDGFELNQ